MNVREVVLDALDGTPLEIIACFSLRGEDERTTHLMPNARSVIVVGAPHGAPSPRDLEGALHRVDLSLALARVGSRRVDATAALLPRLFHALGVWLVDVDVSGSASESLEIRRAG
jgi:hypothetical protein